MPTTRTGSDGDSGNGTPRPGETGPGETGPGETWPAPVHHPYLRTSQRFYRRIPYRNLVLDVPTPPFPQENGDAWSINRRVMADYDLFACEEGSARFAVGDATYDLFPGMLLLVPPGVPISAHKTGTRPVRMVAQHFMLYLFHTSDFFSHIHYRPLVQPANVELVRGVVAELRRIAEQRGASWSAFDTSPLTMVLLQQFIEAAFIAQLPGEEEKIALVLHLISRIDEEYTNPHLLDRLMEESPYGYSHTANLFRGYTGRTMKSFIIERRMDAGKAVLLGGGSVRRSARAAGYDDEFYYSRIFKKYVGLSPRRFRERA